MGLWGSTAISPSQLSALGTLPLGVGVKERGELRSSFCSFLVRFGESWSGFVSQRQNLTFMEISPNNAQDPAQTVTASSMEVGIYGIC